MEKIWRGTFRLYAADAHRSFMLTGVSGNSRQRRKIVRRWKAMGYVVKNYVTGRPA